VGGVFDSTSCADENKPTSMAASLRADPPTLHRPWGPEEQARILRDRTDASVGVARFFGPAKKSDSAFGPKKKPKLSEIRRPCPHYLCETLQI